MRNRYLYSLYLYMGMMKAICRLYNNANVGFLKGYVAHFCCVRLKSFDTFIKVVEMHHDNVTANCILRMLADNVTVMRLVYLEPDEDLRTLRHCLYVIDGCVENLSVLPEEVEIDDFKENLKFNRDHRKSMINQVNEILNNSPLKSKDEAALKKIVEDRNWKFKEFKYTKWPKDNQYKQKELYKMIDHFESGETFSFLSQYAHGLSMSNLVINNKAIECESIICKGIVLLETMIDYTLHFFKEEQFDIFQVFLESDIQEKLFSCFDKEYRPKVNEWNGKVYRKLSSVAFK